MAILGSARHRGRMTRKGYEFKHSALCARAIAGDVYPRRVRTHADRFLWKVVEPTHMCQDDTHKSIRELHLSFHFID